MIVKAGYQWYMFYYIMLGMTSVELVCCSIAFKAATGAEHRKTHGADSTSTKGSTGQALKNRITWLCALFLLGYVGVEVSVADWLVSFMLEVRHAQAFAAGMTATGFWLGLTCGRFVLGFATGRMGEKLAIAIYLLLSMALELLLWLIPSFISSAVFSAFLGFFLGPLFPAAVVVATRLLPIQLHVSAIGFAAAFGGGGAAILPFAVGAIAQAKGVRVLQPIVLALLAALLVLWCTLPGGFRRRGLDEARIAMEAGLKNTQAEMTTRNFETSETA
ncbi:MAG: hypothetical protein M1818_001880 [Claussenomyces sp. TS43310]|nr:MAG: hypothetical protein M1818_001880 [Claussenomyces sp. TS43310]